MMEFRDIYLEDEVNVDVEIQLISNDAVAYIYCDRATLLSTLRDSFVAPSNPALHEHLLDGKALLCIDVDLKKRTWALRDSEKVVPEPEDIVTGGLLGEDVSRLAALLVSPQKS